VTSYPTIIGAFIMRMRSRDKLFMDAFLKYLQKRLRTNMKPFSCYIRNQYFELYMYLHIINKIIL